MTDKRLTGVRTPYAEMPTPLRDWVDQQLGSPVVETIPRTGGMSPAVAATVVGRDGSRAFVKAVSAGINPDTPTHFRHEITVLSALDPVPYRANLLGSYDDEHWVAMMLEDVDGDHPDWDDREQIDAVFAAVTAQTAELTPHPPSLVIARVSEVMDKHQTLLADPPVELFSRLPPWVQSSYADLMDLVRAGGPPLAAGTLCHFDVRHDNLLVRRTDGQVVTVDWGMSRHGPWWGDVFVLALEWAELDFFDELLERAGLTPDDQRDATRLLASMGCYLVLTGGLPAPPALPHLPQFRAELGDRCLQGVHRRLDLASGD